MLLISFSHPLFPYLLLRHFISTHSGRPKQQKQRGSGTTAHAPGEARRCAHSHVHAGAAGDTSPRGRYAQVPRSQVGGIQSYPLISSVLGLRSKYEIAG